MTDNEILQKYIDIAPFLGEVLGPNTEIAVYDLRTPEHSLVAIHNNLSGRECGCPVTNLAKQIVEHNNRTDKPYVTNYVGKTRQCEFISSTFFIKNGETVIGTLCINKDTTSVTALHNAAMNLVKSFNLMPAEESEYSENLESPVSTLMHTRISEIIISSGLKPEQMSMNEKIKLVHKMNDEGIMLMKGAVAEIASLLSISIPTVYRYMNKEI